MPRSWTILHLMPMAASCSAIPISNRNRFLAGQSDLRFLWRRLRSHADRDALWGFITAARTVAEALNDLPPEVRKKFPRETMETVIPELRSTFALFDLAWKPVSGSPLGRRRSLSGDNWDRNTGKRSDELIADGDNRIFLRHTTNWRNGVPPLGLGRLKTERRLQSKLSTCCWRRSGGRLRAPARNDTLERPDDDGRRERWPGTRRARSRIAKRVFGRCSTSRYPWD